MNKTIKNYLNTKIKLNALIVEMKKHGSANAALNQFYCFDALSWEHKDQYYELKKELDYVNAYFLNYVKMKKYIINYNITLEYAQKELKEWEDLKFRYNMIDRMNKEEKHFYNTILYKVNKYKQIIEILNERGK